MVAKLIYILLFILLISCGSGGVDREKMASMYMERISMYKLEVKLYLEEMHKTAELLAKATEDKNIQALFNHFNTLNYNRSRALMEVRRYERLLQENNERGY